MFGTWLRSTGEACLVALDCAVQVVAQDPGVQEGHSLRQHRAAHLLLAEAAVPVPPHVPAVLMLLVSGSGGLLRHGVFDRARGQLVLRYSARSSWKRAEPGMLPSGRFRS